MILYFHSLIYCLSKSNFIFTDENEQNFQLCVMQVRSWILWVLWPHAAYSAPRSENYTTHSFFGKPTSVIYQENALQRLKYFHFAPQSLDKEVFNLYWCFCWVTTRKWEMFDLIKINNFNYNNYVNIWGLNIIGAHGYSWCCQNREMWNIGIPKLETAFNL